MIRSRHASSQWLSRQAQPARREPDLSDEQRAALEHLQDRLLEFDGPGLAIAVQSALNSGLRPLDIVLQGMAAGMKQVGQLYEDGEFFLPQLVMAGATMKHGMAVLEPLLQEARQTGGKGTVVLGTVQGDLHDIGKNLVGMMLQGAGFVVVDLGVDVAPQKFVEAAQAHQAQIVALSALLTTTMPNMGRAVDMLRQGGLGDRVKVMIGARRSARRLPTRSARMATPRMRSRPSQRPNGC